MLTYKRKLILSKAQKERIDRWIDTCRFVYNMSLEIRIASYRNKQKSVSKFELMRQLTEIKHIDWIDDVPAMSLQNVIERLDASYEKFFNGGGFPYWATKKRYSSILFKQSHGSIRVSGSKIRIPKIGELRFFKDCEINGAVKIATIKQEVGGYFICITTDATKNIQNKDENQVIGMDMGVKYLYVDSNGNFVGNPKHFKKYEDRLRIESRSLSRKKKGSNSWKRQCKRLALLHFKVSNVRRDFLHKESTAIAKNYSTVYLEDLNIKAMSKNSKLSKHVVDCGWYMFRTMLSYKTTVVPVNPKYTSQFCNVCGAKDSKSRVSQSRYSCTSCGVELNADLNAAKNILGLGRALNRKREALACA